MSLEAMLKAMVAAGASVDVLIAAVEASEKARASDIAAKRKRAADRQARWRERNACRRYETLQDVSNGNKDISSSLTSSSLLVESPLKGTLEKVRTEFVEGQDDWPADYEVQFWNKYPRKVGRKKARAVLRAIRHRGEVTFARLMAGIDKIKTDDPKFIPHPTTWLNRGGWDDEDVTGGHNGQRNNVRSAKSNGADFFAGLESVAQDIAGQDSMAGPAREEIPLGRVNIDGQ